METVEWSREAIAASIKEVLKAQGIKMPVLAMPVRVLTRGYCTYAIGGCGAGIAGTRKSLYAV